jgi:predicted helicase
MVTDFRPLQDYISTIEKELVAGNATEHTHRSALKALIEGLASGVTAVNEPKRIDCGAPDFLVSKGALTIGYIEAKDIGKSLDEAEKSEQLKRYLGSLPNLILTDYLEFRWYVDGKHRRSERLGTLTPEGKIKRDRAGVQAVAELLDNFLVHKAEAVGTPKELAKRMARLAHRLRELVAEAFKKKLALPTLDNLYKAFCDTLIADLTTEQFADMYAQTITYGLFAARCNSPDGSAFNRQYARDLVPKTNPFLRNIFDHIAGAGLPEIIAPEVDDLVQLLAQADMEAVLKDFGKRTAKEDPVVHFYETFLREYDKKVQEMRGVYYTPEPVVSYIVCSIDHLLKTRFNKPLGLADPDVFILDPAVGTATFLYMVVNEIHQAMVSQGQKGMWNDYVAKRLLPRLFGFELLMAPYAVAHLKLGLQLQETGYQFQTDQRLGIYLTNTLEEAIKHSETLFAQWITDEANAAAEIKKEKPIMVVLGNPPYSGVSANASVRTVTDPKTGKSRRELTWIGKLIEDYKIVDGQPLGERKHWLQDDYVKFIRFGQWRIERTGQGILGFITNHAYLDNPTFRGMRQSLMNNFSDIYILNLHGNVKKKEVPPDGSKNENVFEIQQGVAIGIFVKEENEASPAKVYYADMWGMRDAKYNALSEANVETTSWVGLEPHSPDYFFVPRKEELRPEYEKGWKVTDIFPTNSNGVLTKRDNFAIDFDSQALEGKLRIFCDPKIGDDFVRQTFALKDLPNDNWSVSEARRQFQALKDWGNYLRKVSYRTFDERWIFYHHSVVARLRFEVLQHILNQNRALICQRQTYGLDFHHIFVSDKISDHNFISNLGGCNVFPLYLYPMEEKEQPDKSGGKEAGIQTVMKTQTKREPNLNPEFTKVVSEKLGLEFVFDGKGDLEETFGPEDIFNYAYAVSHSPTYRRRYAEFLKIDFPRLPLTSDKELFRALANKGEELAWLHLMESPVLEKLRTQVKYEVSGSNLVEKMSYNEAYKRVYINKEQYFEGVPPEVWNFHIGGYQVCQKWLKDRKDRTLSYDERTHYQKVVVALTETIRLMKEIDQLIPSWPIE